MKLLARNTSARVNQQAFTVVELIIAVTVLVILAGIVAAGYKGINERSVATQLTSDLEKSAELLELDYIKANAYPATSAVVDGGKGFIASDGVTMTYKPAANLQTYCLQAVSSKYTTMRYIITQNTHATVGTCP